MPSQTTLTLFHKEAKKRVFLQGTVHTMVIISEEIARQLENSQAKYILTIGLFLQNIKQACELYGGIEKIIVLGMDDKPDDVLGFIGRSIF